MVIGSVADRLLAPAVSKVERRLGREINDNMYSRQEASERLVEEGDFLHEVFTGPHILLVGEANDGLFRAA